VQRYGWDKAASYYERCWQTQLEPAQTALLELTELEPGDRVLDVACGTGLVTFRAASIVAAAGEVIGTDISEQMVMRARNVALAEQIANVHFERMDAEQLHFGDATFDAALCALGLMYVPDPERAVGELFRVLRPGGRAVAAVWGLRSKCGWAEIFFIVEARVRSDVCPLFFRLGTGQALPQTFASAGFANIVNDRIETQLHYTSADEACAAAFIGGPVRTCLQSFFRERESRSPQGVSRFY
jgi:ubiquinone/menaquinone biosynthesis C-methylase UbiE